MINLHQQQAASARVGEPRERENGGGSSFPAAQISGPVATAAAEVLLSLALHESERERERHKKGCSFSSCSKKYKIHFTGGAEVGDF